jgi:hypothetical protein
LDVTGAAPVMCIVSVMSAKRRALWAQVTSIAIFLVAAGTVWVRASIKKGWEDYEAIALRKDPKYAHDPMPIPDGGSVIYSGWCYEVTRVKRFITYEYGDKSGYLVGARIIWGMPLRMFQQDREFVRFAPFEYTDKPATNARDSSIVH